MAMIQPNTTPTVYILVQPQQLPVWAFPLTPFRSSEDDKSQPTRHIPIIPTPELWLHSNDYAVALIYTMYPSTLFLLAETMPTILVVFTWVTPSGLLPWDSHQTMTSVLVWDTGRPNGDQRHPLVNVGPVVRSTAATCLAVAVACPHYGPNTPMSLSTGEGYIY